MFQYLFKNPAPSNLASEQSMLTSLPPELLLNVAAFCGTLRNIGALVRTCRWTHQVLDEFLYIFKYRYELRYSGCKNDDADSYLDYPLRWAVDKPERLPTMFKWYDYVATKHKGQHGSVSSGASAKRSTMAYSLTVAVETENDAAANWLLDHDALTENRNERGWTPLMMALQNKNVRLAKRLVEHGADLSAGLLLGAPCIKLACQLGDCAAELVDMMLERGAEKYPGSPWKFTPLSTGAVNAAVLAGSIRLLQLFIDRGIDVNRHLAHIQVLAEMPSAMSTQQYETLVFLLKRGYYPDWDSEDGKYLVQVLCMSGNLGYIRCLFEHTTLSPKTDYHHCGPILHFSLEAYVPISVTKLFIEHGADVNSRGRDNMSALARSIKLLAYPDHCDEFFQLLMNAGVDVNRCFDAVELAVSPPFSQCLSALIGAGADLSRTITAEGRRRTLLMHAISEMSDVSVIEMILKNAPNTLDAESDDGRIALEYAITSGHDAAVMVLLAHGASIQHRTKHGLSMLSLAAQSSERKCMAVLISHGADVNTRDESDDGWYPLMHAVQAGDVRAITYLLNCGADTSLCDHHGRDFKELLQSAPDLKEAVDMAKAGEGRCVLGLRSIVTGKLTKDLSSYTIGFVVFVICMLLQWVYREELQRPYQTRSV